MIYVVCVCWLSASPLVVFLIDVYFFLILNEKILNLNQVTSSDLSLSIDVCLNLLLILLTRLILM